MIKAAVLGATGYAGIELVRLLTTHPEVQIQVLGSKSFAGQKISDVYQNLRHILELECTELDLDAVAKCDVAFTALPHGASKSVIPSLLDRGLKVIDLSGDYRYDDPAVYEAWYGEPHSSPELLAESVYGLCELHREQIKTARLIGNPGCYTTCSILGAAPLLAHKLADTKNIIVDAKSGVTGAGRGLGLAYHFCECTENTKAYKIATHRHTSEIEQELSHIAGEPLMLSFTPHLIPQKRGILATIYMNLTKPCTTEEVAALYKDYYKDEFFIRVKDAGELPETKHVAGSNFVDIGVCVDRRLNRAVIVSAIDNIVKGAAGQAIQNMNLLFGLDEKTGLAAAGFYL
ncbi:MAG TPA: N-acetyl-gamma-glutamyl-phosphate reductase [Candidatus Avimonoglobus intestinipullorum]|uniref:N-acetyl-gamma-glutamyl-phosphate reductase n=1 Tax=Candidatus Avimonoglobus intestinipullorum TaxID=2840699 RepID=A0A9D1LVJ7_9FIRM|nr:N-acetyl-gamma-glutamyl-phosphate reductase [Candidatus Avimonoglobus intestinipullorum]